MSGTVILADEYPIVLDGLESLLHKSDFKILAWCTTGEETLRALRRYRSDILVFDIHIPLKNGLEILKKMKESKLPARSVVFTARLNDDEILEALRLGISGLVLKELASKLVIQCIRRVYRGGKWFERDALARAAQKLVQREAIVSHAYRVLSSREIEVIRLVIGGLPNKKIGQKLYISEGTVKRHLHTIYKKLKVASRLSLTLYARDIGIA